MAAPTPIPEKKRGASWKLWAVGIAAVVLAIFVFQNLQKVEVDFLFTTTETPLILALLIAGALGGLIGWLAPIVRRGRKHDKNVDPGQG